MAESIKKQDVVELSYTGRLIDGTVFDTTEKAVAEQNNLPTAGINFAATVICVGENQVLPGLDQELPGKEVGQEYQITLSPERAFGKRDIKNIRLVPMSIFIEHKVQPQPGLHIDVDGERGIVSRVSGGRILVNFNHPLAGREVSYTFKIIRRLTDASEKISAYLAAVLRLPKDQIEIKMEQQQAEIKLPMELPAALTNLLAKKVAEIATVKGISFKKSAAGK